jgi:hypothetical protein
VAGYGQQRAHWKEGGKVQRLPNVTGSLCIEMKTLHTRAMGRPFRRKLRRRDLPLGLTIANAGKRSFHYLLLRNDGTVVEASSISYATEAAAREAGLPVLQRCTDAAQAKHVRRRRQVSNSPAASWPRPRP